MSARAAILAVAAAVAAPAAAFQQTCIPNTSPKVCLKWPSPDVSWKLNPCRPNSSPGCQASGTTDPVLDIAKASFQTWQTATRAGEAAPCTDLAFTFAGTTASVQAGSDASEHLIVFRQGWCSEDPDAMKDPCFSTATCGNKFDCFDDEGALGRSTLALTSVSFVSNDGTIMDADTELVDWDGASGALGSGAAPGIYVTCLGAAPLCATYGQAGCAFFDLQDTLTHELGHFIGLAHPCGSGSGSPEIDCASSPDFAITTMYPFESPGETSKRVLSADDVDGVCTLYPRGAAPAAASLAPGALGAPEPASATAVAAASGAGAACIPAAKKSGGCASGPGFAVTTLLALLALALRRGRGSGR